MIRVVELFSGIGAQRMALMQAGIPFEVVAVCEINKHALASYKAIYGDCPNLGDITKVEDLPPCDLVTYSFPCQDLSLAGKRKGMGEGTRSGLVWEVVRLLESERERPEWLLMENVPQVLTSPLWGELVGRLEAMGYRNRWAKLDSSRFGSAQKRVRAFMVSRLGTEPPELPTEDCGAPSLCLRDIMEPTRDERFMKRIPLDRIKWREQQTDARKSEDRPLEVIGEDLNEGQWKPHRYIMAPESLCRNVGAYVNAFQRGIKVIGDWQREGSLDLANRIYSQDGASPTIFCHGGGNHDIKIVGDDSTIPYELKTRIYSKKGMSPTLTDLGRHGREYMKIADGDVDDDCLVVNVLTPLECWRLMGFPYWAYRRASMVSSETQLYNQAGNSIVVEVLEAIFRTMFSDRRVRRQTCLKEFAGAEA